MKKYSNIMLAIIVLIAAIIVFGCGFYFYNLTPISNDDTKIKVIIEEGTPVNGIISILKENNLVRSEFITKIYLKLASEGHLKAGLYYFSKDMSTNDIINNLEKGSSYNPNQISITFVEGLTIRGIAKVISTNTNNSYEDVFTTIEDKAYLEELKTKYPFLEETVTNPDIYYPLEGFLFPNTYFFENKDVSVKTIFNTMLQEANRVITKYQNDFDASKYSIHQIFTLASIIEGEAATIEDMKMASGVFINRLNSNWNLGSDVTSYYGVRVDLHERALYDAEFNDNNPYNTRLSSKLGFPVGPVSNPGEDSLTSVLNYTESDYMYFVADANMKVHFMKTYQEFIDKISSLKEAGLWL